MKEERKCFFPYYSKIAVAFNELPRLSGVKVRKETQSSTVAVLSSRGRVLGGIHVWVWREWHDVFL